MGPQACLRTYANHLCGAAQVANVIDMTDYTAHRQSDGTVTILDPQDSGAPRAKMTGGHLPEGWRFATRDPERYGWQTSGEGQVWAHVVPVYTFKITPLSPATNGRGATWYGTRPFPLKPWSFSKQGAWDFIRSTSYGEPISVYFAGQKLATFGRPVGREELMKWTGSGGWQDL